MLTRDKIICQITSTVYGCCFYVSSYSCQRSFIKLGSGCVHEMEISAKDISFITTWDLHTAALKPSNLVTQAHCSLKIIKNVTDLNMHELPGSRRWEVSPQTHDGLGYFLFNRCFFLVLHHFVAAHLKFTSRHVTLTLLDASQSSAV